MTMTEQHDPIPETVAEALAKWDAGESVFSVEMGGLGPGYEMAIQGLAFEMMRDLLSRDPVVIRDEDLDAVVRRLNDQPWAGFSGAQVGAAKSLAARVCLDGYRKALRHPSLESDRLIQVCKKDLRSN